MIQLIPFLGAAVLLFFTLFLLLRHDPPTGEPADELNEARQALLCLETGLLPVGIVERIFAESDRRYVLAQGFDGAYHLFLEERRRIALAWVRQVRERVTTLWRFRNRAVRHSPELRLRSEARLAWNFAVLLVACQTLEFAIFAVGPFMAPRVVAGALTAAGRFCGTMRETIAIMPSRIPQFD